MQLSAAGLNLIRMSEGFRGRIYRDIAGIATIGYGHRVLPHESFPDGITEPQASMLLSADVLQSQQAVDRLVKASLTQGQFDALTDFCFNLGAGRLASSTLLKLLNAGSFDAARSQLLQWDQSGGRVVPGLRIRRQAEFDLWGATRWPPKQRPEFPSPRSSSSHCARRSMLTWRPPARAAKTNPPPTSTNA